MSFFDKMKQGAADAAKKTRQTVETTRLRAQISSKEKERDKTFALIGEAVYQAYAAGDRTRSDQDVAAYCRHVNELLREMEEIELKIKETKNEKLCRCGRVVAREVKFCSVCGFQFGEPKPMTEPEAAVVHPLCRVCHTANDADAKFCANCGITM